MEEHSIKRGRGDRCLGPGMPPGDRRAAAQPHRDIDGEESRNATNPSGPLQSRHGDGATRTCSGRGILWEGGALQYPGDGSLSPNGGTIDPPPRRHPQQPGISAAHDRTPSAPPEGPERNWAHAPGSVGRVGGRSGVNRATPAPPAPTTRRGVPRGRGGRGAAVGEGRGVRVARARRRPRKIKSTEGRHMANELSSNMLCQSVATKTIVTSEVSYVFIWSKPPSRHIEISAKPYLIVTSVHDFCPDNYIEGSMVFFSSS